MASGWHSDSVCFGIVVNVLGGSKTSSDLHPVVVPSQHEVAIKEEVLDLAVTRDVVRKSCAKSAPDVRAFLPRLHLRNLKAGHAQEKRGCQVRPQCVAAEVGPVQPIPWRVDFVASKVIPWIRSLRDYGSVGPYNGDVVRGELCPLIWPGERPDRCAFFVQRRRDMPRRVILNQSLHCPECTSDDDRAMHLSQRSPALKPTMRFEGMLEQFIHVPSHSSGFSRHAGSAPLRRHVKTERPPFLS